MDSISQPLKASRRQAVNACVSCRLRKTKCDEEKPSCGRCTRLSLGCSYAETIWSKKALHSQDLTESVGRIEEKLNQLSQVILDRSQPSSQCQLPGICDPQQNLIISANTAATTPVAMQSQPTEHHIDTLRIKEELSLSRRHFTAPQYLLCWPCSSMHLDQRQLAYPIDLEIHVGQLSRSTKPPRCKSGMSDGDGWLAELSIAQVSSLNRFYFSHFHPSYPILDEALFRTHTLNQAIQTGFRPGIHTCLALLVFSLGSTASFHTGNSDWGDEGADQAGLGFFNLALEMFRDIQVPDWSRVQCLLLIAMFHSSRFRVYDAWRAINEAASVILILIPLQATLDPKQCQIFWVAYLHESQILAEFDFPSSGLGKLASIIHLPIAPSNGTDPDNAIHQSFFLALITLRKLLNRALYHLSNLDGDESHASPDSGRNEATQIHIIASQSLVGELDRQLEEWRSFLPESLAFPGLDLDQDQQSLAEPFQYRANRNRLQGHLMCRYYSAKSVIYRSCLYRILHSEDYRHEGSLEDDKKGTRMAVHAAFLSTLHSGLLHEPLPLLLHPINSWRSLFAVEIQISFILKSRECAFVLPRNWELVRKIRERLGTSAIDLSATVAKDGELLTHLT